MSQRVQFNKGHHDFGGTQTRTQGLVKGKFIVLDDMPKHLKLTESAATVGEYDVACRYSSEPGDPGLGNRIPQPRRFTMKIFEVHGDMFDEGKGYPIYDIEFNSAPAIELPDAKKRKRSSSSAQNTATVKQSYMNI